MELVAESGLEGPNPPQNSAQKHLGEGSGKQVDLLQCLPLSLNRLNICQDRYLIGPSSCLYLVTGC